MDTFVSASRPGYLFPLLNDCFRLQVTGRVASIVLIAAGFAFNSTLRAQSGSPAPSAVREAQSHLMNPQPASRTLAGAAPRAAAAAPKTAKPQFTLAAGSYASAQTAYITDATPGATIYYTTDGSIPTTTSLMYSGGITISKTATLAAFAVAPGYTVSEWELATYYIGSAPDSFIYTIAGTDFFGFEGDGGPATHSIVNVPQGTAIDPPGNVYIADTGNNRIRKIDAATGIITTIAGTGRPGFSGNGGPAIAAEFRNPHSLAFDRAGYLYVSDSGNNQVRRIDLRSGTVTAYAGGNPTGGGVGDGGPASDAFLSDPLGISFDAGDNLYISDSNRVRRVDAKTQVITTVAGNGIWGSGGDGGPAINANLSAVYDVALDKAGNLYIADFFNNGVRFVNQTTGIITTIAGHLGPIGGYSGDGGPAINAMLWFPSAVAVDAIGNLYISDFLNWRIRKVDVSTGIITTALGNGLACFSTGEDGSPATTASVCESSGLRFDRRGNLYYADSGISRVKKMTALGPPPTITTATPQIRLASGTYSKPQTVEITDATPGATIYVTAGGTTPVTGSQSYHAPIDVEGNLILSALAVAPGHLPSAVALSSYKITAPPASIISTLAGSGSPGFSGAGGPATSAQLGSQTLIPAISPGGDVFIADSQNNVIWKVEAGTGIIRIAAGTGQPGYNGDGGPAIAATLTNPSGVAVDKLGNLFIADAGNNRIREVLASNGTITTVAGTGATGFQGQLGDGGPATAAEFNHPQYVALDKNSNIYVADTYDLAIRRIDAVTGIIETVVGNGESAIYSPDGGLATSTPIQTPAIVVVDSAENIFFSEQYNTGRIRKADAATGILSTVVGDGDGGNSGDGLPATSAETGPNGFTVDKYGNIFISDLSEIRKVDAKSGIITRVGGLGGNGGNLGDGIPALTAEICPSNGITVDKSGNLYFADNCVAGVRKLTVLSRAGGRD
jgi:sugar lactone lactonase YvrE